MRRGARRLRIRLPLHVTGRALYTDDIAKYDAAENGLCFGRIDLSTDGDDSLEEN